MTSPSGTPADTGTSRRSASPLTPHLRLGKRTRPA